MKTFKTLEDYRVECYITGHRPSVLRVGYDLYTLYYDDKIYHIQNLEKPERREKGSFIKIGDSFEFIKEEPMYYK